MNLDVRKKSWHRERGNLMGLDVRNRVLASGFIEENECDAKYSSIHILRHRGLMRANERDVKYSSIQFLRHRD